MNWSYAGIQRDWLADGRIAVPEHDVVAAFDRCERMLGRGWIDRMRGSETRGAAPTLAVVSMGQALSSLEDVSDCEKLIHRIRADDPSARAELRAIYLLRSVERTVVELEPVVTLPGGDRKCDFRLQRPSDTWVYVEVTQPDTSDAKARVDAIIQSVVETVMSIKKPFALEIFLRREPTEPEIASVISASLDVCSSNETLARREELPDGLGLMIVNEQTPEFFALNDHGEERVPRVGSLRAIVGPGEPNRSVAVRMAYADQRAERFLTTEARQLPTNAPGLIMVEMLNVSGGFVSWEPIIRRRFQPTIHTRVGGVCLFSSGLVPTPDGEAALFNTKFVANQHARIPLPAWVRASLDSAGEQFKALTNIPSHGG